MRNLTMSEKFIGCISYVYFIIVLKTESNKMNIKHFVKMVKIDFEAIDGGYKFWNQM